MHDAIEHDVRVGPSSSTEKNLGCCELLPAERVWKHVTESSRNNEE